MYSGSTTDNMRRDPVKYRKALKLRKDGISIRTIAKKLKISTSTASIWCRSIELTADQKNLLALKSSNIELLRSYAQKRHQDKIIRNENTFKNAQAEIQVLTNKELFLVGLALYWAEGFKSLNEGRIGFCNSDPKMVRFIIKWFKQVLGITNKDFILRAEFNQGHAQRKQEIEEYWSKIVGIPLSQFNKPFLQKAKQVRDYSKRGIYYGVLRIRVRKSTELLVRIRGWLEGLSLAY